jgi:2-haloacid dehalogenase
LDRVRHGELPWTRLDDLHRASLAAITPSFGLGDLSDSDLDHLTRLWHRLRPWPDSRAGLARLKRRFVIAPLSNGNVSLLVALSRQAELHWDTVFGADLFRHYKPDPETYLGACAVLDLPPAEVMMAAAHNGDLAAAQAVGLQTAFFPRPAEYGPHQERDTTATGSWTIVAQNIEDLADRLGA